MKKLISIILAITIFMSVIFSFSINVFAAKTQLGSTNTYYSFNSDEKILTISGTGATPNYYNYDNSIPWYDYNETIKKVVVEEGVTTIGNYLLDYCAATEFVLPSTLKTIGSYAFSNVHNVSEWVIPNGVTSIGTYAFSNSVGLKRVVLPTILKSIGARAFSSCYYITDMLIPASVKSIGIYAFYQCTALEDFTFQSMSSNITIGGNCFTGCTKLKNISIPKNAVCSSNFYGYYNTKTKYTDVHLNVYKDSNAHNYAIANGFDYSFLDDIAIECGIEYYNYYSNDNMSEVHHYSFIADSSEEYCFYTVSEMDLRARLELNNVVLAENDDISRNDADICIKYNCVKGQKYDLYITSVYYSGSYNLIALPTNIDSFTVNGDYSINASNSVDNDGELVFSFDNSLLEGKQFTVNYANGLVHSFNYSNSFYDGAEITVASGLHLECGNNDLPVFIGDKASSINVNVEHSYTQSIVEPTPDEDGYTLNSCINCDDSFKTDFFKTDKPIYTLTGRCVLGENRYGSHSIDLPYYCATIRIDDREYPINTDGTWEIRTFGNCNIVFDNHYGMNATIHFTVDKDNPNKEYGIIALDGYDFNNDGYVNARDYAIYKRDMAKDLCDGYWQFIDNFITTH